MTMPPERARRVQSGVRTIHGRTNCSLTAICCCSYCHHSTRDRLTSREVDLIRYCIGIEGFGIGYSVGVLSNLDGEIISSVREQFHISLHATDKPQLLTRLSLLLSKLLSKANLKLDVLREARVCISLTGVTYSYDRQVVLPNYVGELRLGLGELICTGDAEATLASHASMLTGSVIIAHTGSTAYVAGEADGQVQHYRFGGWGPAISDDGSGYWMGRLALRHICEQQASKQGGSILWHCVREWLDRPTPSRQTWDVASGLWKRTLREFERATCHSKMDARTLLFHFSHALAAEPDDLARQTIAGLTVPVMKAYAQGDESAGQIVQATVDTLVQQHTDARRVAREEIRRTAFRPVVLYGGLLVHHEPLRDLITERLVALGGSETKVLSPHSEGTMRTVMGALLFALAGSRTNELRTPQEPAVFSSLFEQIRNQKFQRDLRND